MHNNNNNQRRQRPRGQHNNNNNGGGQRPRSNPNNGGGYSRNQTFDSNGPDVRVRGTAQQVYEKYLNSARDASAISDHIRAENLLQHAEHYFRIIASTQEQFQTQAPQGQPQHQPDQPRDVFSPAQDEMSEEQPSVAPLPAQSPAPPQPEMPTTQASPAPERRPRQPRPRNAYIPPAPVSVPVQPVPDEQPSLPDVANIFPQETDETAG